MATRNVWKTSDIRVTVDSVGFYTAEHKYQGLLIDGTCYDPRNGNPRTQCRREAVEVLREMKDERGA
jgi:hypothetical protein